MVKININNQFNCRTFQFPDQQPHINISGVNEGDEVQVTCAIRSANDLLLLLECSNALDNAFAKKKELVIPYLMGARFDRLMQAGDSVDLKVIANLINGCGFQKVYLYDVHSDTATVLIDNSVNISNTNLVDMYNKPDAVLICPDGGAVKKVHKYLMQNINLTDIVYCNKTRNLSNGNLTLQVLEPEKCAGRNCVIIDDLCDGGGTFLGIAQQINPAHLTLIVTHGIFSRGLECFRGSFDQIIVSDSYSDVSHDLVEQVRFSL